VRTPETGKRSERAQHEYRPPGARILCNCGAAGPGQGDRGGGRADSHQSAVSGSPRGGGPCGLRYRAGHTEDGGGGEAPWHGQHRQSPGAGLRPGLRRVSYIRSP